MSFQPATTNTSAAPSTGFSFGLNTPPAAAQSFSFGAGDSANKPASFGAPATSIGTPATTSFGAPATTSFGAPATTSFGAPATTFGAPATTSFGAPATSFGAPAATNAAAPTTFSFPQTAVTSSSTFATKPTSTTTTVTSIAATVVPQTTASSAGFVNLSTTTNTTNSSTIAKASQLSYNQLEEHINKWTLELEEQEKVFIEQATQINAWDKILIGNNQKILDLNEAVQKVKIDQQTLEQELEFIATQHKELEDSIVPLQKEFMQIPQVDVERSQTYLLVENLDTQLKQMSEDLREIIDSLNEANKGQDNSDPIIQIGKILNAHMSSLQWIESSSSNISNKLDDLTKMHETFKREPDRSAYYN